MRRNPQAGLTLIEVMIASAIMVTMMALTWRTISNTADSRRTFEQFEERNHELRMALDRIVTDFEAAYLSKNEDASATYPRTMFIAKSNSKLPEIRFSTLGHRPLWADANESEQTVIQYLPHEDRENRGLRRAGPRHRVGEDRAPELEELAVAGHVGHDAVRRPEGLAAESGADHDRRQVTGRRRVQALHRGAGPDAGTVDLHPMSIWTLLPQERGRARSRSPQKRRKQRGVALVAVMIAIAIILVITNQFGSNTNADMIAAANYRDKMRAHFLARSAANLAELVIRIQQRLDNQNESRGPHVTDI